MERDAHTPSVCLQRHRIEILRVKLVSSHFARSWAPDEKNGTFSAFSHTDSIEGIASANPQTSVVEQSSSGVTPMGSGWANPRAPELKGHPAGAPSLKRSS